MIQRTRVLLLTILVASVAAFSPLAAAQSSVQFRLPAHEEFTLPNGLQVVLIPRHQLPLVSFHWIMRDAGAVQDPAGKEGLASVAAELLRKGTQHRSADELAHAVDFVGGTLSTGVSKDYAEGSAEFLSKDVNLGLDLLADILRNPTFPKKEVDKLLRQRVDEIKQEKEMAGQVIQKYFNGLLYGPSGYGRPASGTETGLPKLSRKDAEQFYRQQYGPNRLILAVAGDFVPDEMRQQIRSRFEPWRRNSATPAVVPAAQPVKGTKALLVEKPDATQVFFQIGNVGLCRTNPDWIPVQVVNLLFGGRFTSMLNSELRIKSGLTYHANSFVEERLLPGSFSMYFYSGNETAQRAVQLALQTLKTLHEHGITPEQLESAKAYIKGQFGPKLETNDQLAEALAEMQFYRLGVDYIDTYLAKVDAVTPADAQRVIADYFPLNDALRIVLIGKGSVIEPIGRSLTPDLQKRPISAPGF